MREQAFKIPDICRNSSVLLIMLVTELGALVVTLLINNGEFLSALAMISLYLQWVVLPATLSICLLRARLNRSSNVIRIASIFGLYLITFTITEVVAQQLTTSRATASGFDFSRYGSLLVVTIIVVGLVVRWFTVLSVLEARNKAEMHQRFQALQSRIQPHFLFNSLNTISELVATNSDQAEQAIQSLALLFRVNLETEKSFHSIESELNLCKRYLKLETWRLGDRLRCEFSVVVQDPKGIAVPKLLLQPLIENSVVHGGGISGEPIDIKVDIRESRTDISINVTNVKPSEAGNTKGNGISTRNIRDRLFVMYDDKAIFRVKDRAERYDVLVRIPKQHLAEVQ